MTRKRNDRLGTRGQTASAATAVDVTSTFTESVADPRVKIPNGESRMPPALVSRNEGAAAEDIAATSGPQRHTMRAAPTRPRRAGLRIDLGAAEDGRRVHHIVNEGTAS